jgi:hypothetical protein
MSVFAFDGAWYTLPATDEIREAFDPKSGFEYKCQGHYPQCLVSTAYDVFRRLPVARTVVAANSSEREQVKELLHHIPPNNLLLFDRGYPSYELLHHINENYTGYYIFRCISSETFPAVKEFVASKEEEDIIYIKPSRKGTAKYPKHLRKSLPSIQLRVIRMTAPDGGQSVLLTNLLDSKDISKESIIRLYWKRWEIESYYRDEKIYLQVETFHSKNVNGIRQELFAAITMAVIAPILMVAVSTEHDEQVAQPQFKNAVLTIANEAVVMTPQNPRKAVKIFKEILREIWRVRYYPPKTPRPNQPRVTKKAQNKWINKRAQRLNSS